MSEPKLESWLKENGDVLVRITLDDVDLRRRIDTLLAQIPKSEHAEFWRILEHETSKRLLKQLGYPTKESDS